MTDKAKNWFVVYLGLVLIFLLWVSPYSTIIYTTGAAMGALFGGAVVAPILRFFWKKHTLYELWFASAAIWFSLFLVAQILGVQR